MSNITVLDQSTINQIAAGEVIERPAAVVKELVENSIDAKATSITVEIKEGGISFIRITDNGSGIPKEDIAIAFLRHSTSKIKSIEDLLSVSSLGFRGEALSSIAAVSQVELLTKIRGELNGIRYVIEGGIEKAIEDVGCPEGTTFIVRNLFYHTPARRKFLKSPTTETGYISDLIERLAVSHPDISFKFIVNNQIKLHTSGNGTLKDIVYHIYGREIAANVLAVNGKTDHIIMSGFVGKPIVSRGNRNYMNYYINGRYIKSEIINKAIEEAYKPFTMTHRYPFTAIYFTIESDLIDVNVHPTKMDIRFRDGEEIYSGVFHTIRDALEGKELIPNIVLVEEKQKKEMAVKVPEPFEVNRMKSMKQNQPVQVSPAPYERPFLSRNTMKPLPDQVKDTEIAKLKQVVSNPLEYLKEEKKSALVSVLKEEADYHVNQASNQEADYHVNQASNQEADCHINQSAEQGSVTINGNSPAVKETQITLFGETQAAEDTAQNHRIIGQLFSTYWLVQYMDKMFIIDQHAAHEKVLYEKLMKSLHTKEYLSQMLLPPIILTLNMREEEALKAHMDSLKQIGFEIESFGGKEYSVRAVPSDMFGVAAKELLIEIIDSLVEENHSENLEIILEKIASVSCKAAVKGNNKLSISEAETLIRELMELDNPYHCPHGRPTIVSMSKYEIEKKFKRIVV